MSLGLCVALAVLTQTLACLSPNGQRVDWFAAVKLPHSYVYAYIDSSDTTNAADCKLAKPPPHTVTDPLSAMARTLAPLSNSYSDSTAYVMYNDAPPDGNEHLPFAHSKGVLGYNGSHGFWLLHSVPHWPYYAPHYHGYPYPQSIFSQSFFCLALDSASMTEMVSAALLVSRPYVYSHNMPDVLRNELPLLTAFLHGAQATTRTMVQQLPGLQATLFAKSKRWHHNINDGLVARHYGFPMAWATWRNGVGSLQSCCAPECQPPSMNVHYTSIANVLWYFTLDHAKWGVTLDCDPAANATLPCHVACYGDMNREHGQSYRGGMVICLQHACLWSAMRHAVAEVELCDKAQ